MPNPFGFPSMQDISQFGSDALGYLPDALKGSVSGTLGMPVDIYQLLTGGIGGMNTGNPDAVGSSNWIGNQIGANTKSPSFDIARMTAIAPPAIGGIGKILDVGEAGNAITKGLKPMSMAELQMFEGSSSNAVQKALGEAHFHLKNGNVENTIKAMEEARNAYSMTEEGKQYAQVMKMQDLLKGP